MNLYMHHALAVYEISNSLAKLAAMSGRVFVWPEVDCRGTHVQKIPHFTQNTTHPIPIRDPRITLYGNVTDLKCSFNALFNLGCSGVGLSQADFERTCSVLGLPVGGEAKLSDKNTLLFDRYAPLGPANFEGVKVWDKDDK